MNFGSYWYLLIPPALGVDSVLARLSVDLQYQSKGSKYLFQTSIRSVYYQLHMYTLSESSDDEDDRRGDVDMLDDDDDDSSDAEELSDEEETTHNMSANKNPWMSSSKLLLLSLSEIV